MVAVCFNELHMVWLRGLWFSRICVLIDCRFLCILGRIRYFFFSFLCYKCFFFPLFLFYGIIFFYRVSKIFFGGDILYVCVCVALALLSPLRCKHMSQ